MKKSFKDKLIPFFVNEVIKRRILRFLPDKQYIILDYFFTYGKVPNLQHPMTISEKIQWIKIYGDLGKYNKYVDKYEVRNFVRKTIGKKYLIPLIGVWEKFDDIPFDKLPHQFVLKATHGSTYVFICTDKSSLDINALKKTIARWMHENYYQFTRETQYKLCKPMIICEKYLEDESGGLMDYKIYCSNGEPHIVEVIRDRFTEHKSDNFLDLNWKKLPIFYPEHPPSKKIIKRPENLEEMIDVAKKLSKKIPFVRVDLYSIKNKIYFGELTFAPDNGFGKFAPPKAYYLLGELIDLSKYGKNTAGNNIK